MAEVRIRFCGMRNGSHTVVVEREQARFRTEGKCWASVKTYLCQMEYPILDGGKYFQARGKSKTVNQGNIIQDGTDKS